MIAMSETVVEFSVNQKIVYPSQGVGEIREITEKTFKDKKILYYVIYLAVSDMVVMVPVDKAVEIGIRSIVKEEEALRAIALIGEKFEPITSDWKLRYQMNLDLLKKGRVEDIATIVRSLYHRSKVKELPIQERKLYDSARKLLEDEISYSLGKPVSEVEAMILEMLEPDKGEDSVPDYEDEDEGFEMDDSEEIDDIDVDDDLDEEEDMDED